MPSTADAPAMPFLSRGVELLPLPGAGGWPGLPDPPGPKMISRSMLNVTRGVAAGLIAGVPQVLVAQAVGAALGVRERADIGPRFVEQAAEHTGRRLSRPMHWLLAALFHFEYASAWGVAYAAGTETAGWQRVPAWLGGVVLAPAIYAAAFSSLGGATRTGTEPPVHRRQWRETVLHCAAAGSFAFSTAYVYRWLRKQW